MKLGGRVVLAVSISLPNLEWVGDEPVCKTVGSVSEKFNSFYENLKEHILLSLDEYIKKSDGISSPHRVKVSFTSETVGKNLIIDRTILIRDSLGKERKKAERDVFSFEYSCFIKEKNKRA